MLMLDIIVKLGIASESGQSLRLVLNVLSDLATAVFLMTVVVIMFRRLQPVRRFTDLVPNLLAFFGAFLPLGMASSGVDGVGSALVAVSGALVITGTTLAIVVLCHLGRAFSVLPEARTLVTTGPYRLVRHPLYVCEAIATMGMVLVNPTPFCLALYVLHLCLQLIRTAYEEKVLRSAFPEYGQYRQRVPRFIPRLSGGLALAPLGVEPALLPIPLPLGSPRCGR
jgi:protein-S-isoprenylcysteine O-methyltransferase Ste14